MLALGRMQLKQSGLSILPVIKRRRFRWALLYNYSNLIVGYLEMIRLWSHGCCTPLYMKRNDLHPHCQHCRWDTYSAMCVCVSILGWGVLVHGNSLLWGIECEIRPPRWTEKLSCAERSHKGEPAHALPQQRRSCSREEKKTPQDFFLWNFTHDFSRWKNIASKAGIEWMKNTGSCRLLIACGIGYYQGIFGCSVPSSPQCPAASIEHYQSFTAAKDAVLLWAHTRWPPDVRMPLIYRN